MALTAEQRKAREGKLTASAISVLLGADNEKINDLWRQLAGDPTWREKDLSGIWPVQLGSCTETLQLDWYERKTGRSVTRRGEVVVHPTYPWAACTLDGWDAVDDIPIEVKHVGGREPLERIVARYYPQVTWQMIVTGARKAVMSIIEGANEPLIEMVHYDSAFADELLVRAIKFMECVESMTPPRSMGAVAMRPPPVNIIDMTGSNEWAHHAGTWLEHLPASQQVEAAEKGLKALMPLDAKQAHGYGVRVNRDRANRLSLRMAS